MYDLTAIYKAFHSYPEEAVFFERALILEETRHKYTELPPGERQGRIVQDLCNGITPVVIPQDALLCRIKETIPTAEQEQFIAAHPELFLQAGVPGWLEATNVYIPDWQPLLTCGLGGLIEQTKTQELLAENDQARDLLLGARLSLEAVSNLALRYSQEARRLAHSSRTYAKELLEAADCCESVALAPPATFRQALQLFVIFHTVLSCIIGGRDVTPGRVDQYFYPFYQGDLASGRLTREEAIELLAIMMIALPQLSGPIATDFQSKKRSPTRYSHYYLTLGGVNSDGASAVNDLSHACLEARRLVLDREPTLCIRYFEVIDRDFWKAAVEQMRDGLPVFPYNDEVVIPALLNYGIPLQIARNYAHCACLICFLPGRHAPVLDGHHNAPYLLLLAMNEGRDLLTEEKVGATTPTPDQLLTFEQLFEAFHEQLRFSLRRETARHASGKASEPSPYPLLVKPLLHEPLLGRFVDQRFLGFATTVDSLLALDKFVYQRKELSLSQFLDILKQDYAGHELLRLSLNHLPCYGSDEPEVSALVQRVGRAWIEEVLSCNEKLEGVCFRPSFHSWLYNLEYGRSAPATPDGRRKGEPLSLDFSPSQGRGCAYTEVLRSAAAIPTGAICSGGSAFHLSPSHFEGESGVARLAALIAGYFDEGGLQAHFVFADPVMLEEAVAHPEQYRDLLVRVTGFSEYFVRLLPEVQQEIIKRAQ